ncbi:MAG: TetR/AcrR family transcriptional regulator [Actinomycetia bacterium]|nr:TetR/AcrR family transcriptional regulator [Actinomycetes bacterium]MCP5033590.1 TetR/AcrR family transcriptional regulator [Actinomycetes bacterium]
MALQLKGAAVRSEATSARIVAAAKKLFVTRSYADVTTDTIAQAADVTKGGLYHHFASKEQLYVTMMLQDLDKKQILFAEAVAVSGTCRERLAALTRAFLELPDEDRELTRLVRRDINSFAGEERKTLVLAYQRALPEQVESIITDGINQGELAPGDARILSWSFIALVEVVISDYAADVLPSIDAGLDHVLDLFFRGAAADPNGEAQ